MNNWLKIGVPVLIGVLLIIATVGITLAVTGKAAVGQAVAPGYATGAAQFARGPQCSNCIGSGQGAVAGDQDDLAPNAYSANGAACPGCPGYNAGTSGQPAVTGRGGCCAGR